MEIRKANLEDKQVIINLWKYCFYTDSEAFIHHYFSNVFSPENTVLGLENNNITTSLQLNPYVFNFLNKDIETKYIVGFSSFPESRGSGSARKLFKYIFQTLYKDRLPFVFLMGADYGLYTPYGFTNVLDKYIITGKTKSLYQKTKKLYQFKEVSNESSRDEIEALTSFFRKTVKENYSNYILRDANNFKNNLFEISTENGFAYYLIKDGKIAAYFFYYFDQEKIVVKEMLYNNTEVLKEILQFIYNHNTQFANFEIRDDFYKTTTSFLKNPREVDIKIMPFLMARIINLKEFLSLTNIQNKIKEDFRLMIVDRVIKENNILCVIKNGDIDYIDNYDLGDYDLSLNIELLLPLFLGYINKDEGLLHTQLYKSLNNKKSDLFFDLFRDQKNIFFNEYV